MPQGSGVAPGWGWARRCEPNTGASGPGPAVGQQPQRAGPRALGHSWRAPVAFSAPPRGPAQPDWPLLGAHLLPQPPLSAIPSAGPMTPSQGAVPEEQSPSPLLCPKSD